MNQKAKHDISRKLKVLRHADENGNISKTCRYFGICRETFYTWRRAYKAQLYYLHHEDFQERYVFFLL